MAATNNHYEIRYARFQLYPSELAALDQVQEVFYGSNETDANGRLIVRVSTTTPDTKERIDKAFKETVKTLKKLPTFKLLTRDGQFELAKASMWELHTVNSLSSTGLVSLIRAGQLDRILRNGFERFSDRSTCSERQSAQLHFLQYMLGSNPIVASLVKLLYFFSHREAVTVTNDRLVVYMEHGKYTALLRRYLGSLYGDDATELLEMLESALSLLPDLVQNKIAGFVAQVKEEGLTFESSQ